MRKSKGKRMRVTDRSSGRKEPANETKKKVIQVKIMMIPMEAIITGTYFC